MMNKNQKICLMVAIFSVVILFISGTDFQSHYGGNWFSNSSLYMPSEERTNYIAIFSACVLAVSCAGLFILED